MEGKGKTSGRRRQVPTLDQMLSEAKLRRSPSIFQEIIFLGPNFGHAVGYARSFLYRMSNRLQNSGKMPVDGYLNY
ncbi:hypothetical protein NC653_025169 [Populus alba x Populus x berolinensis]|uniref:Uncharacterized protein n=1 Tax=Populus alba x Populus x berolinensis TaxID=444605 RepID=A0AAD6Q7Q8_9ROSI|nr:hypothetical protein NC653_025169 [Populus alba x Populus x berolinensis]